MRLILTLFVFLSLAHASATATGASPQSTSDFALELSKIQAEARKLSEASHKVYAAATTDKEREAAMESELRTTTTAGWALAARTMDLVMAHPKDPGVIAALTWLAETYPGAPSAPKAADLLIRDHLKDPKTQNVVGQFTGMPVLWSERLMRALAAADLPVPQKSRAIFNLATALHTKATFPAMLRNDPKLAQQAGRFFGKESMDAFLATDVKNTEAEAARLFTTVAESDKSADPAGLGTRARAALYAIEKLGIGRTAPEIAGDDVDGKSIKLSEFRGKVVMLDFWGHW